jgi:2-polyprenyl-3-methyl-5-hydroxy-6-metoxy-1,4-benzoquinol methylase
MAIRDDRGFNQVYEQNQVNLIRLKRRADWMIAAMDVNPAKKVMEIGCGTGYVSHYIAGRTNMQVIGSDLCKPFIEEARRKFVLPNLSYEILDFNEAAEAIIHKFDYIIGNGILHHLYYNLDKALLTLKGLLNPGGEIIFMEPNVYNPYIAAIFKNKILRKCARLEPDEMAFSKRFIGQQLKTAGFKDIKIKYKDFLLPGILEFMIDPSIVIGDFLERTPLRVISQSLLINATR